MLPSPSATGKQTRERLKANRQRFSPEQISASRAWLAEIAASEGGEEAEELLELDASVRAPLDRAHRVLEEGTIGQELADQIHYSLCVRYSKSVKVHPATRPDRARPQHGLLYTCHTSA